MSTLTLPPLTIRCPCDTEVDVPITAELARDEQGREWLNVDPDMADLWAHNFTHQEQQ